MQPLVKYLVAAGAGSRRTSAALVMAGHVKVNDHTASSLMQPVKTGDQVKISGTLLENPSFNSFYLILHKPLGYLTTVSDDRSRPTVMSLMPKEMKIAGLVPVGRLDLETTGLLLLTNDGQLAYRLTHPRYRIEKEYHVVLDKPLNASQKQQLLQGIQLTTNLARIVEIKRLPGRGHYAMTLTQGEKRQIRLMAAAVGRSVRELKRVRMGNLHLSHLASGTVRPLVPLEIRKLQRLTGLLSDQKSLLKPNPRRRVQIKSKHQ